MVVDEHISHFFIWSIKACIYTGEEPLSLYIYIYYLRESLCVASLFGMREHQDSSKKKLCLQLPRPLFV